ncbi:MAG: glutamate racemase [Alicyclobacillus sp.]|nr:glutamate racemase [Alicyclobacillus sp.]
MASSLPIGLFDSGVGGLTVAAALRMRLPRESVVYFGDTARCPYGDRSRAEVIQFSREICRVLMDLGVKMLVVACNTATASALPTLAAACPVPLVGVIEPGATAAVRATRGGKIGVIGTSVTIGSRAYERAVHVIRPDVEVVGLACPAFVPLVEQGRIRGPEVDAIVHEALAPLRHIGLDTLILGCTHYPYLSDAIQSAVGPDVTLISSAEETARWVARVLADRDLEAPRDAVPMDQFLTTGDPLSFRRAVDRALGSRASEVRTVALPSGVATVG